MGNLVRIIEESNNQIETKILVISFDLSTNLKSLFIPRLVNISFIIVDNTITVNLKNPDFRELFNDWVERFSLKINVNEESEIIIEKFNKEIKSLILLGKKEIKLSWKSARGLYGEFLVIYKYLLENKYTPLDVIEGWHRPEPANHDFDYNEFSLEVKTVSRDSTKVKITSQFQLESFENKLLMLNVFRIEKIEKSNVDSLGDLFNQIKSLLTSNVFNLFEIKCAEDFFCEYLGPELMPLDYKFTLLEDNLYKVDQDLFPRVKKQDLNPAISKFSYSIDISSFESFKIN
jgi:hypothetical protein